MPLFTRARGCSWPCPCTDRRVPSDALVRHVVHVIIHGFILSSKELKDRQLLVVFTSWNTASHVMPRPPLKILCPYCCAFCWFLLLSTKDECFVFAALFFVGVKCAINPSQSSNPSLWQWWSKMHWSKGHPPFSHYHTPSFSATWLWNGNSQPFCVCSALFFFCVCLLAPSSALASNPTDPPRWAGRVTHSNASLKGGLRSDYGTERRSTATNSLTEGCPVNQTSQWSCCCCWEGGRSRWQLKDQLMNSAAGCQHTQQNARTVGWTLYIDRLPVREKLTLVCGLTVSQSRLTAC